MTTNDPRDDVDREAAALAEYEWEALQEAVRAAARDGTLPPLSVILRGVVDAVREHVTDPAERRAIFDGIQEIVEGLEEEGGSL